MAKIKVDLQCLESLIKDIMHRCPDTIGKDRVWVVQFKSSVAPGFSPFDWKLYPYKKSADAAIREAKKTIGLPKGSRGVRFRSVPVYLEMD